MPLLCNRSNLRGFHNILISFNHFFLHLHHDRYGSMHLLSKSWCSLLYFMFRIYWILIFYSLWSPLKRSTQLAGKNYQSKFYFTKTYLLITLATFYTIKQTEAIIGMMRFQFSCWNRYFYPYSTITFLICKLYLKRQMNLLQCTSFWDSFNVLFFNKSTKN